MIIFIIDKIVYLINSAEGWSNTAITAQTKKQLQIYKYFGSKFCSTTKKT